MAILDELKIKANGAADTANNIQEAVSMMEFGGGSVSPEGISSAVAVYLDEHLTNPTNPPIDASLTIEGAAADSKKTGTEISQIKEDLSAVNEQITDIVYFPLTYWAHYYIKSTGELTTKSAYNAYKVDLTGIDNITLTSKNAANTACFIAFYTLPTDQISGAATADPSIVTGVGTVHANTDSGEYTETYQVPTGTLSAVICGGASYEATAYTVSRPQLKDIVDRLEVVEPSAEMMNGSEITTTWVQGGISMQNEDNANKNRIKTGYITGNRPSIYLNDSDYLFSVRYYHDDTFIYSDTTWRSESLIDAFSVAEGCNRIRIIVMLASNADFTPSSAVGVVTVYNTAIPSCINKLYEDFENIRSPKEQYAEEIEATAKSVRDLQTEPCITFAFVTDIHYKSVNGSTEGECLNSLLFEDCATNIRAVSEKCHIDFVFGNGDYTDGHVTKATTKDNVFDVMNCFRRMGRPFFLSVGNHDDNRYKASDLMTASEMYANYIAQASNPNIVFGSMGGTNYYFDFEHLKIRFIVINSNNFSGDYEFTEDTRTFLTNALADMPTGYQGFLFVHTPPATVMNYNSRVRPYGADVETIINNSGRMCAMFYGHSHQDNSFGPAGSDALNTYDYLAIATCCEKCTNSNGDPALWSPNASMPLRTVGTYTEDLWDVVVIRPTSRKINMVRFGAGVDREFSY